jgi:hypothetical protein
MFFLIVCQLEKKILQMHHQQGIFAGMSRVMGRYQQPIKKKSRGKPSETSFAFYL